LDRKTIIGIVLAIILVVAIAYFIYAYLWVHPGAWLESTVKIRYEDGTEVVLDSNDFPLFSLLKRMSVITYGGKKIWGISTQVNIRFTITPPDRSLKAQWWLIYWTEQQGTFFWGGRAYHSWIGFVDVPLRTYSANKAMFKWQAKVMNPELSWFQIKSFVDPFYRESTSSIWVDLSTYVADPKTVTDALSGIPIVGGLADTLGARLSSATVKDGDRPLVVSWDMKGYDFYTRLKRSNWNGLSVHLGDFSIGVGEFARMWDNDAYTIRFKAGYFFRYQDISGEWSKWKYGTVTIATLNMKIVEGSWYVLSAEISGNVNVQT